MNITNATRINDSQQHRRLSFRRGSVSAPDPFGRNSNLETSRSIVSRITVVRASPLPSQDHDNLAQVNRRASWGTQRPAKDHASHGRSRLSFAFASFTPNSPIIGDVGPARTPFTSSPAGSGPPSPELLSSTSHISRSGSDSRLSERIFRSSNIGSVFSHNALNSRMTPEQICEIAVASVKDSLAPQHGLTPCPFIPLPDDVYLPFVDRPSEVSELLDTNMNFKIMYILSQTFPVDMRDRYNSHIPASSSSRLEIHPQPDSSTSIEFKRNPPEIAENPEDWSYTVLDYWLRHVTREQADDREWVLKARACVLKKNEHIWTRLKDALGVPAELEEEYEEGWILDDYEEEPHLHESVTVDTSGDNDGDSVFLKSEDGDTDDRNHDSSLLSNALANETESFRDRIGSDVSIVKVEPIIPGDDPEVVVSPMLNAGTINNLINSVKSERSFGFGGKERGMENIGEGLEEEVTPSEEKNLHKFDDLVASSSASIHSISSFNSGASNEDSKKLALMQNQINGLRITTAVETVQPQVSPHSVMFPRNGESLSSSLSSLSNVRIENSNLKEPPSVLVGHYLTALSPAMNTLAMVDGAVAAGSTPLLIGKNGEKLNKEMIHRPSTLPRRRSSLPTHIVAMAEYGLKPLSETVGNLNTVLADRGAMTKRLLFNDDGKVDDPDESGTWMSEYTGRVKSSAQQERGTGGHLFIRSFMDVGLEPTLVANNPALRAGARRNFRPGLQYRNRRKDAASGGVTGNRRPILSGGNTGWDADGNDYAISLGSGSERSFR